MNMDIGVKVKFLNEKGHGVISRFINKNTVGVIIEDGFEIPYLISELIALENTSPSPKAAAKKVNETTLPKANLSPTNIAKEQDQGIYIAITRTNHRDITHTDFNIWLINHTPYDIAYTYAVMQQGKYNLIEKGDLNKKQHFLLETICRKNLHEYAHTRLDAIFYSQEAYNPYPPISENIKLKPVKMYKENAFVATGFMKENAIIVPVILLEKKPQSEKFKIQLTDIIGSKHKTIKKPPLPKPNLTGNFGKVMEIDLHIEELLDDYSGMSNFEIVRIQLEEFQKALDNAIKTHCSSLIAIHGIGSGRLKQEITSVLKTSYPKIRFKDASYSKYGLGATEILLT